MTHLSTATMHLIHLFRKLLRWQRGRLFLAGLLFTCLMAGLYVLQPRFLQFLDYKVYDALFQATHATTTSGAVAVVDLDEASLAEYGQWPWPRYRVALLVEKIRRAGAAAIALDIVFAEEDRTSPVVMRRMLKNELGVDMDFTGLPPGLEDNDAVLAGMLAQGPYVLGYYFRVEGLDDRDAPETDTDASQAGAKARTLPRPLNIALIRTPDARAVEQALFAAGDVVTNIPVLGKAAPTSGFINVGADMDGIVRRAPLAMFWDEQIYPSLALAAVLQAVGADTAVLRLTSGGTETLRVADRTIPLDGRGRMLLHYRGGRQTFPTHSVRDVLQDRLTPGDLKDKIVFIGTSAAGLMDIRSTPLDPFFPGVEAQATVADTIIAGDFLSRPDWAPGLELILVLGMGLLSTLALVHLGGLWPLVPVLLLAGAAWFGSRHGLAETGLYISPLMPLLTLVGNFSLLGLFKFWNEEREKRKIRTSFEHYLSPEVIARVVKNPNLLKLGGEKKELTVFFTDIRNFTTLSESLEPNELVTFMNEFHSAMTGVILEQGGTLDKYIGDAIMAFFGAPVDHPKHALIGCKTALQMFESLYQGRAKWCFPGFSRIEIGVGISSGEMIVGNMGSAKRLSYTVMGDQVNLAARLEGLTKFYGVKILISQFTHAQLDGEIVCREIDLVRVKGKTKPVAIFEPFNADYFTGGQFAFIPPFEQGLKAYRRRDFQEAVRCFEQVLALKPQDNPSLLYVQRCQTLLTAPPPEEWDGVWAMTNK
ncbi:adenylate cyclase [Desulfonatronum zhilinae]|nr:adenylate cyclase [Desulfonatronum zhilinae]